METGKWTQCVAGTKTSSKIELLERYKDLKRKEAELETAIANLESRGVCTDLTPQMQALYRYNEMKDLTQFVLGYLATVEQTTVGELHKRYELPLE